MIASLDDRVQERPAENDKSNYNGSAFSATVADAVRRHLDGDREAITELVRLVRPWLYRLALGYRLPAQAADDVVQNTLLAFWQHIGRLRDPQTAVAWLSVVARHRSESVV